MTLDGKKVFENEVGGEEDLKSVDQKQAPAAKAIRDRFRTSAARSPRARTRSASRSSRARIAESDDELLEPLVPGGGLPRVPLVIERRDRRARQGDRHQRYAEPQEDLRLPSEERGGRAAVREADRRATLARNAFRRPVTDADLAAPLKFYETGQQDEGLRERHPQAVMAVLASPKFLYRVGGVRRGRAARQDLRINDFELASRLSFFLWSQVPDDELLDARGAGKLHEPASARRAR